MVLTRTESELDNTDYSSEQGMFITVKYGNDESLLCNPSCAIINLLNSIKRRAGYADPGVMVDLSDETGLVKELDQHKMDYASKYLSSHGTYVLVEKQEIPTEDNESTTSNPSYQYIPLLDNYDQLFPNFRVHVQTVEKKRGKRNKSQSPSPAGVKGVKGMKNRPQQVRAPSRKK